MRQRALDQPQPNSAEESKEAEPCPARHPAGYRFLSLFLVPGFYRLLPKTNWARCQRRALAETILRIPMHEMPAGGGAWISAYGMHSRVAGGNNVNDAVSSALGLGPIMDLLPEAQGGFLLHGVAQTQSARPRDLLRRRSELLRSVAPDLDLPASPAVPDDAAVVGSGGGGAGERDTEQPGATLMIILEGERAVPTHMREPVVRPDHEADNGLSECIHSVDVQARFHAYAQYADASRGALDQAPDAARLLAAMQQRFSTHPNTNRLLVEQLRRRSPSSRLFAPVKGQHVEAAITAMARRYLRGVSQHRSNGGTSKGKVHANTRAFVSVGAQHGQMISRDAANAVQTGWRFKALPPTLQLQVLFLFEAIGGLQAKVHVNLTGTAGLDAKGWRAAWAHTPHADGQRRNPWRYCMAIGMPLEPLARNTLFQAVKAACEKDYIRAHNSRDV